MGGSQERSSEGGFCWRAMAPADLDFVLDLAARLYPDHPESRESFAAKLEAAPDACLVAEKDGSPVGYCVALRATCGRPPQLDEASYAAREPIGLHLHDIALDPVARGQGLVASALDALLRVAGNAPVSLIAVNGTAPVWTRYGFTEAHIDEEVRATYGEDAVYMLRKC